MHPIVRAGILLGVLCGAWTFVMGFTGWYRDEVLLNLFYVVVLFEIAVLVWGLRQTAATRGYGGQVGAGVLISMIGGVIIIGASVEMDRIADSREASQPLRSKTGGSTFKNPADRKAWQAIDAAGLRGLRIGDAQVSEKHCNFLLNLGEATSADIEALGEEVRRRVKAHSGVELEWEIQRVGVAR